MAPIIWIIVIISGLGVWMDAAKHGIKKADKVTWYQGGPMGWGLGTMLLWILIFPTYLFARERLIAAAAQRTGTSPTPLPLPHPPLTSSPTTSVADEIRKLADLRDRGALTDAEFEAHKAALRPPPGPTAF